MSLGRRSRLALGLGCLVLMLGALAPAETSNITARERSRQHVSGPASSAHKSGKHRSRKSRRSSWRNRQKKIDAQRVGEIQMALIRANYLHGQPTGVWDQATRQALVRYQEDNGWQTKVLPDSRALIKLGLGPNHDHLINPESAMTSDVVRQAPARQADSLGELPVKLSARPSASNTADPAEAGKDGGTSPGPAKAGAPAESPSPRGGPSDPSAPPQQ